METKNDRVTVIPMGLVGILASTSCLNPFTLLSLGYTGVLTERGLEISPREATRSGAGQPTAEHPAPTSIDPPARSRD